MAISRVNRMRLEAPTVWQMAAHELLHSRFVNVMHGKAMLAQPTRKMFSDLHISLEARQNVPSHVKKKSELR
jgi:hypothetical protein